LRRADLLSGLEDRQRGAGYPKLALLDLPRRAPAGLEVAPDDADDLARLGLRLYGLLRARGHVLGCDAGDREQCRPARVDRLLQDVACGERVAGLRVGERAWRLERIVNDLRAGVQQPLVRVLLVHDPPDHADREERDRERDEQDD